MVSSSAGQRQIQKGLIGTSTVAYYVESDTEIEKVFVYSAFKV